MGEGVEGQGTGEKTWHVFRVPVYPAGQRRTEAAGSVELAWNCYDCDAGTMLVQTQPFNPYDWRRLI